MAIPYHTQAFLDSIAALPKKDLSNTSIHELRQDTINAVALFGRDYEDVFHVEDVFVESTKHKNPIKSRFYMPHSGANQLIVYVHGGGWCRGSVDTYDTHMRDMANTTRWAVLSIDYGLAPENPFPGGLFDVIDVYRWVQGTFAKQKNFKQIVLMGDSGGGNIAAASLCYMIRHNIQIPDAYVGIYPSLDFSFKQKSYETYGQGYVLSTEMIKMYVDHYLVDGIHKCNYLASPMLFDQLSKFPKTYILTAELDPLADEQEEFCEKLHAHAVYAEQKIIPGVVHPFMIFDKIFPEVRLGIAWIKEKLDHLNGGNA
ncbi:MAG: alpha/beta hydrolase [Alphaproteobacteria bacterium]|nr:alpha/beta hydrolase [Alphaproteobacteria bacterium]